MQGQKKHKLSRQMHTLHMLTKADNKYSHTKAMQGQKKHTDKLLISNAGPEKHNLPTQLTNIYYYMIRIPSMSWSYQYTHPEWGNLLRIFPSFSWCSDPFCSSTHHLEHTRRTVDVSSYRRTLSTASYSWSHMFEAIRPIWAGYWVNKLGVNELGVDESGVDEPGIHLCILYVFWPPTAVHLAIKSQMWTYSGT